MPVQNNWGVLEKLGVFVVPGFLDAALRARLMHEAETEPAHAGTIDADSHVNLDLRRAKCVDVTNETGAAVSAALDALRPALTSHFHRELRLEEYPPLLCYVAGDFYRPHRDRYPTEDGDIGKRVVSTVAFVNAPGEEYAGGALLLSELFDGPHLKRVGIPVFVEPGLLVAFPSSLLHEVTPVERGRRYTLAGWYHEASPAGAPEGATVT